jgi:hypothetical protein
MSIVLDGTLGLTTPAETVSGTGVWSVGSTQIYKDASGNVGIGTGSPNNYSGYKTLTINGTATTGGGEIDFQDGGTTRGAVFSTNTGFFLSSYSSVPLQFGINGSTKATLDTSGNLGLGVTPSAWGSGWVASQISGGGSAVASRSTNPEIYITSNAYYNGTSWIYKTSNYATYYAQDTSEHKWYRAGAGTAGNAISFTQVMTLDTSGNLLVGTTSGSLSNTNGVVINPAANSSLWQHISGTASGTGYIVFGYNGNIIGSITQNGTTGTLYNLTSDYRLKNNPTPLTGAKEFVMALQPKTWDWWDGSGKGVGFIAHEFMEVAQYSGHGEKDAVDEDGNIIPQSIQPSSSEVMANLVALIQEQQAIITSLTERLTALENK